MRLHATRLSILSLVALTAATCTDAPQAPDVMSELPGEVSFRTFTAAAESPVISVSGTVQQVVVENTTDTYSYDLTYTTSVADEINAGTYQVAVYMTPPPPGGNPFVAPAQTLGPIPLEIPVGDKIITAVLTDASGTPLNLATARSSVEIIVRGPCVTDADCEDGYYCGVDVCLSNGTCVHGAPPAGFGTNCCQSDFECPFGQYCDLTVDGNGFPTGPAACVECLVDAHCEDGNLCTVDSCNGGVCENVKADPECCDCNAAEATASQCNDGKFCTTDSCDCSAATCGHAPVVLPSQVCCEGDPDNYPFPFGDECDEVFVYLKSLQIVFCYYRRY